jgi:hypothetical protein
MSNIDDFSSPLGLEDVQEAGAARPGKKEDIDFEFDLNYGMEKTAPPKASKANGIADSKLIDSCRIDFSTGITQPKNLTIHQERDGAGNIKDGFEVRQDGNRMEISTMRFGLEQEGRDDLTKTMNNIMAFVTELETRCKRARPITITPPPPDERITKKPLGKPRCFTAGFTSVPSRPIFPLGSKTYFRDTCEVLAAPQATIDLPLAAVDALVTEIKKSMGKRPGAALTGWDPQKHRAGVRSDALFHAQAQVKASREAHLRRKTRLRDGTPVTAVNFTTNLQGFMILLVQYLRTSEIKYGSNDYEGFAKAYVPLLAKTHFRDMFHRILSPSEQQVFMALYGDPRDNLYALAGRPRGGGTRNLFPGPDKLQRTLRNVDDRERVQWHQDQFFSRRLTWHDLVQMTINDTPLNVDVDSDLAKCLGVFSTESLFTPLAKASNGPAAAGPKGARVPGVRVELRRIGFTWVPASRWKALTDRIFELARRLNGVT